LIKIVPRWRNVNFFIDKKSFLDGGMSIFLLIKNRSSIFYIQLPPPRGWDRISIEPRKLPSPFPLAPTACKREYSGCWGGAQ
jgi:hypothetical protein